MWKEDIRDSFILLIGLLVIILVWIVLSERIFEENEETMNTTIGLIGAILGGAISGGLTLFGVRVTIKHQIKKDNLETYPNRIQKLRKLEKIINHLSERMKYTPISMIPDDFLENANESLELAVNIDNSVYNKILQLEIIAERLSKLAPSSMRMGKDYDRTHVFEPTEEYIIEFQKYDIEFEKTKKIIEKRMEFYQEELEYFSDK
ncbi:hypothetical protein [Viridibacillus sp. FSL H8-0123]|uniref:hypothetical protein n=1 Tax=Viridibacillus sp. FSL H8-0123 TaxID=1928922 RepID=UPI00096EB911|nr:hypothetical protein [Viridibacillus sp. FSL H8-0123]OMC83349.1 hypothetical protein BK130_07315 [Viridibacillus sp. FSL H8-0123]